MLISTSATSGSLPSQFDFGLVALSVGTAVLASYAALDLAGRVSASRGRARALWLIGGAFAMGFGIWSMHYVGMLAFKLHVPVMYDVPLVVLSLLAAIAASAIALWVASRADLGFVRTISGSVAMGIGISAMHYTGMAAMRLPATLTYLWPRVALSVAIAIAVAFAAMWFSFRFREQSAMGWSKVASAVLMGSAIPAMHYVGMWAVRFSPSESPIPFVRPEHSIDIGALGLTAIVASTFMVLAIAIGTSRLDSFLSVQAAALKTSEGALRAQELFLREVIDANPHLIFAKDWDGRFTLANRTIASLYGTTASKLVGKTDADFNPDAQQVAGFLREDRAVMTSGEPLFITEQAVTRPDTGETVWFQTIKVPLRGVNGERTQVLGVATDITQRKVLEDQLRQAQKMEAVGRLAGGVAHDFNNLLTAILGNVELLTLEAKQCGNLTAVRDLTEVREGAERAAGLTRQLLAFSRKQVLRPEVIDVGSLVEGMHKLLARTIGDDVELRLISRAGAAMVTADPGQLGQVILNLAMNARDAMPLGGRLTITTSIVDRNEIAPRERQPMRETTYVLLALSDSGVGMTDEVKSHIFEPFFTTKTDAKCTGLGLATVYGIVKQSGGFIWVDSEPGVGTTFRLYFPQVAPPSRSVVAAARTDAGWRGTGTILVAEDDPSVRRLVCRVLGGRGYHVIEAADGVDAVHAAAEHHGNIDLMVSDVVMPRMSGRDAAARLAISRPAMKVLFVSGYTDDAVFRDGVVADTVSFLHKPFKPDDLERRVKELMTGSAAPVLIA